ncbi:MAG: glycosyltransferase family 2 protein [Moorea sp. SIO2B7]|nr:glycosyltransferase family 2 protein [Moorena sp. SIO2B7]
MAVISIIIPVRNRKEYTRHILDQIYTQISQTNLDNISVIVIDDGSTDGTPEIICAQFPEVKLIQGDGSLWWTGAICLGMEYALEKLSSDYFVWVNDDISISEEFLMNLNDICDSPVNCNRIIGGIVRDRTYPDWIVFSGMVNKKLIRSLDFFAKEETKEVDTLNGNIAIIPRSVVDKIGLPDSDKFQHYGGDFEFVLRAKNAGFSVVLSRKIQAITDYQMTDFIRYMPPWMQWKIQPNLSKRKEIIIGFTNLKSHYNIWHQVNINSYGAKYIPSWKYFIFYFRQIIKVLSSDFWSQNKIDQEINNYFKQQNVPSAIAKAIMSQINSK